MNKVLWRVLLILLTACASVSLIAVVILSIYTYGYALGDGVWLWRFDVTRYSVTSRYWTAHQPDDMNQYIIEWETAEGHQFQAVIKGAQNMSKLVKWLDQIAQKDKPKEIMK